MISFASARLLSALVPVGHAQAGGCPGASGAAPCAIQANGRFLKPVFANVEVTQDTAYGEAVTDSDLSPGCTTQAHRKTLSSEIRSRMTETDIDIILHAGSRSGNCPERQSRRGQGTRLPIECQRTKLAFGLP